MHMIMFELVDEGSWQKRWEEEETERRKFEIYFKYFRSVYKNII